MAVRITQHRDGQWRRVEVSAPAKVNLFLAVGGVPEGEARHQLLTVFQCLDLSEQLRLSPIGTSGTESGGARASEPGEVNNDDEVITRLAPGLTAPSDLDGEGNLIRQALRKLREVTGAPIPATRVEVEKNIPVAGGMAGGSADAAGTLAGANALYGLGLTNPELEEIGAEIGADVPAILRGGNALGRRFGDVMTSLPSGPKRHWVLAISSVGLSTPEVFREFDRLAPSPVKLPDNPPDSFLSALTGSAEVLAETLQNDLEDPALRLRPELGEIKATAIEAGALAAIISGSGPTIACLCADEATARRVQAALQHHPQVALALPTFGPEL